MGLMIEQLLGLRARQREAAMEDLAPLLTLFARSRARQEAHSVTKHEGEQRLSFGNEATC